MTQPMFSILRLELCFLNAKVVLLMMSFEISKIWLKYKLAKSTFVYTIFRSFFMHTQDTQNQWRVSVSVTMVPMLAQETSMVA